MEPFRCGWCGTDALYCHYHDTEWGIPVFDDQKLFETLILETFQAGLSWITVLRKREAFREAFMRFNPEKMSVMQDSHIADLMQNPAIIRNLAKIKAAVHNARCYIKMQESGKPLGEFLWQFTDGVPQINHFSSLKELPAKTELSDRISKELKDMGFAFMGSTVVYAHMQATGMVNDHLTSCFRYRELTEIVK
jgi:DNA-3-methyladenine glycosylase I